MACLVQNFVVVLVNNNLFKKVTLKLLLTENLDYTYDKFL